MSNYSKDQDMRANHKTPNELILLLSSIGKHVHYSSCNQAKKEVSMSGNSPWGGVGECHVKGLGMPMLVKKHWIKHGSSFILPLEISKTWTDFFH